MPLLIGYQVQRKPEFSVLDICAANYINVIVDKKLSSQLLTESDKRLIESFLTLPASEAIRTWELLSLKAKCEFISVNQDFIFLAVKEKLNVV